MEENALMEMLMQMFAPKIMGAPTDAITDEGRIMFQDPSGRYKSAYGASVNDRRLNDGAPTNIPTYLNGHQVSLQEAIERAAGAEEVGGPGSFPAFMTNRQAVDASRGKSRGLDELLRKFGLTDG